MSPSQFGTVLPGDIKYKDVNGDGVINDDDRVPLFAYSGIPQFMYGLGFSAEYKGLTLNVLFKGTGRNYFLYGGGNGDNFDGYMPFNRGYQGNVLAIAYDQKNRWTSAEYSGDPSTENPNARFPRLQPRDFCSSMIYNRMAASALSKVLKNEMIFTWTCRCLLP